MIDLRELKRSFIAPHIVSGGTAVDFTMGNGNDTVFLSDAVGEQGRVYAFDIQEAALKNTECLLTENNCAENYTLILDSHSNVRKYINTPFCAGIFNLGYLPGSGHKELHTMRETTVDAVTEAIELIDTNGILFISVYPGHAEGAAEGEVLEKLLEALPRNEYCATKLRIVNSETSPYFLMIERK